MRYDDRLKTYIISSDEVKNYTIDYLNNFSHRLIIEYPNTASLSRDFVSNVTNLKIGYRIVGGYDKNRIDYWTKRNLSNALVRKGRYGILGVTYYEDANIYNKDTMIAILDNMKKIESGIMPGWSDLKKALYIYDRLREEIIYHPDYEKQESFDIRTLRGLISKKTVCAGYACIFKEFMDRLGIECHYVEGATTVSDQKKEVTTHAWNIIKIHGEYFPIDLTWDAGSYRQGQNDSFAWFSQVDRFKKRHYPHILEKVQDYNQLRGLKRSYVKRTMSSFNRKKDFSESVIKMRTSDDERVVITQLEKVRNISDRFNPIYRYAVSKVDKDGKYTDYRMVYSDANLLSTVSKLQWKKIDADSVEVKAFTELFSYRNIDKCRNIGSSYIGSVELNDKSSKEYKIINRKSIRDKYPYKSRQFSKNNGDNFIVSEDFSSSVIEGNVVYSGHVGYFTENGYREYSVCSDKSLFDEKIVGKENSFYSDSYLDRRVRYAGGYLGYINEYGRVSTNSELDDYYNINNSGDIKRSDVIWEDNVYNSQFATVLEFGDLKDLFLKYEPLYNDDFSICKMVDRENNEEITDKKLEIMAKFASMWVGCAGTKLMVDEVQPGITYAFNDGSSLVYDYLITGCCNQLESTGMIDFDSFSDSDMLKCGYSKYKHAGSIIDMIFKTSGRREILFNYCNMQVEAFKDRNVAAQAGCFVDTSRNLQLESMLVDSNIVSQGDYYTGNKK